MSCHRDQTPVSKDADARIAVTAASLMISIYTDCSGWRIDAFPARSGQMPERRRAFSDLLAIRRCWRHAELLEKKGPEPSVPVVIENCGSDVSHSVAPGHG
jgi:hypothetical protein